MAYLSRLIQLANKYVNFEHSQSNSTDFPSKPITTITDVYWKRSSDFSHVASGTITDYFYKVIDLGGTFS